MKSIAVFFNNYSINQGADYVYNTNAEIDRVQCERNKCENELHRLRYGLENLFGNKAQIQKKRWIDRCWPCCRRWNRNRYDRDKSTTDDFMHRYGYESPFRESSVSAPSFPYNHRPKHNLRQTNTDFQPNKTIIDPPYKSLFFKNLEAKVLDCLGTSQRVGNNQLDSISITPLSAKSESPSISSLSTNNESFSPFFATSQPSSTETISSLESSSISAFPTRIPTTHIDLIEPKLPLKTDISKINNRKKSQLAVPVAKISRSGKSKKKKASALKNKRPPKLSNTKKTRNKQKISNKKRRENAKAK